MTWVRDMLETQRFRVFAGIMLGVGLATVFRRTCGEGRCVVIRSPDENRVQTYVWKGDDGCYVYRKVDEPCDKTAEDLDREATERELDQPALVEPFTAATSSIFEYVRGG
jgi:hypothetical protein